ncbi:MerR family transcriptional regulator [Sphaerotilus natans subsp. natans DSM 6575]|jgi:DNA-binding transcriptional MerR regulator|uniref:MerR family transcriptional regulator n=1 Tax=Sphaerotilus natans subsp. natans DSM 6575 TaxID=1286631 RepID=A0A059KG57_9BURK|nr:MerR family transcriptional regulator [Sphaerotilus natans]KDB50436.1 MerR family transcriptional regulator [Sphaerotilus natans subsp. natans DSM 6575]SIP96768.1 MerR HTH family regulatory protein [Sphaerotilus natans]
MTTIPDAASHTLAELCALVDLPARTVRYYMQLGLVDRPVGETRAARYGARHLEQLLQIRRWSAAGLSLERIRALLQGETPELPARAPVPGTVTVCSHLTVADGVELVIDPGRAGVSSEQLRVFVRAVMAAWDEALRPSGPQAQTPP